MAGNRCKLENLFSELTFLIIQTHKLTLLTKTEEKFSSYCQRTSIDTRSRVGVILLLRVESTLKFLINPFMTCNHLIALDVNPIIPEVRFQLRETISLILIHSLCQKKKERGKPQVLTSMSEWHLKAVLLKSVTATNRNLVSGQATQQ